MEYGVRTLYWDPEGNQTKADELWDAINTDDSYVAIADDMVESHGLEVSMRFPWDTEKGLYVLKGVHDLHCIVRCLSLLLQYLS